MAGKRYSAGRIFLQVVPSFNNLQRDIGREVNKANPGLEKAAAEAGKKRGDKMAAEEVKARRSRMRRENASETGAAKAQAERVGRLRVEVANKTTRSLLSQRAKEAAGLEELAKRHQNAVNKITGQGIMERAKAQHEEQKRQQAEEAANQKALADLKARMLKKSVDDALGKAKAEQAELDRINKRAMAGRIRDAQREYASKIAILRKQHEEQKRLSGGATGQNVRNAARGALEALGPETTLSANASKAEKRIAALRRELATLADAHIGVDIDAGEAMAKMKLIREQMIALSAKDINIDVDINIAAALAKMKVLDEVADRTGRGGFAGMFSGLRGSAEDGANSFRVFNWRVFALVSLLPALPPLLAASAGGLAAIATAAVGGAAGLGVMILGFTGIGAAVSALGDVQDNATKDALASTKAIRNAARSLRDAQQGLSRARMQAARAAEDSNRRIADAERNLADAQQDAADAQDRLRKARKAAQQDQDDLADRIKAGALDERQALIDLFNAQVAYNAAKQDGGATNLEREQASIDLERARLAIKNIREENAGLADEQKKARKEGVEGNDQVVAANKEQERAQRRVADAQRAVADAQREAQQTAIDNTLALRDAQERVTDAQAAYQEALTQTGDIGSASMDKLRQAMGKLSPAGRAFATYLFSLRDEFYRLRAAAQEGMLPGVQKAMQQIINRYGPEFFAFVSKMSRVAGQLFVALGEAFTSPAMVSFFETMDKYAPEFFSLFALIGIDFMKIIAGIMTAFAPFAKDMMTGLADLTASWAEWAQNLKDNPEFQKFIAYIAQEGPKALRLVRDILKTIINIGKGMASNGAFDALVGFFDFVSDLDPRIIASVVQAILGLFIASQVSAGIVSLWIAFKLLTATMTGLVTLGIFALVVGLVILYKKNEWFRDKVDKIWAKVKEYVAAFFDWFQAVALPWLRDVALPVIIDVWHQIADAAVWLWKNVLQPVFTRLWAFLGTVFYAISGLWKNILWPVFKALGQVVWWLWKEVFWPVFKLIGGIVFETFKYVLWVWDHILKPVFDSIAKLLNGDFVGAWRSALDAIKGIWDGLKLIISVPVNAAIDLLNGLVKGINKIFEAFGSDIRIPLIAHVTWGKDSTPTTSGGLARNKGGGTSTHGGTTKYATGGYTGPGGKYEEAGVVHRDEYVLRKEATNRLRKRFGLDWLDHLNRFGDLPRLGFADGGLVDFGKRLQGMGFNVAEHPVFGGVHPVHTKGSQHYNRKGPGGGGAVDVNYDGHGQGFETNKINSILSLASQYGLRTIWQAPGHYDHAHFDIGKGADIGKSSAPPWVTKPLSWLKNLAKGVASKIPGKSILSKLLRAVPNKIVDAITGKINSLFSTTGELGEKGNGRNNPTFGVQKWRGTVMQALSILHQPMSLVDVVLRRMNQESSGDPRAINMWDSNARAGTPSKGLMQVIDPTFAAYRMPSLSGNIYDPLANLVASMRYAMSRYGSLPLAYGRPGGYWTGGLVGGYRDNGAKMYDDGGYLQPGWTTVLNATGKPEPVFTADQWDNGAAAGKAPLVGQYHQHFHGDDGSAAGVFADEFNHTLRRISHGGVYAGRTP